MRFLQVHSQLLPSDFADGAPALWLMCGRFRAEAVCLCLPSFRRVGSSSCSLDGWFVIPSSCGIFLFVVVFPVYLRPRHRVHSGQAHEVVASVELVVRLHVCNDRARLDDR